MYIPIILCISFLEWIGNGSRPDQFLVARAASGKLLENRSSEIEFEGISRS